MEGVGYKGFTKAIGFHTTEPFYLHFALTSSIFLRYSLFTIYQFTNLFASVMVIFYINFSLLLKSIVAAMVTNLSYCFKIACSTLTTRNSLIISKYTLHTFLPNIPLEAHALGIL